jgi:hypothetical protein
MNTADDYRAEKVMFVIITDGEEIQAANTPQKRSRLKSSVRKRNTTGSSSSRCEYRRGRDCGRFGIALTVLRIIMQTAKVRR